MSRLKGWSLKETIGLSVLNPKECFKLSGSPEQIMKLLKYIRDNYPDQLDQETIDEIDRLNKS